MFRSPQITKLVCGFFIFISTLFFMVPGGRIELPWIAPHDFESCASTNSAIPACCARMSSSQHTRFLPKINL